jgi:DNA-binding MarR family transcriptional regulator
MLIFHIASDKHILACHGLRRVRFYMLRHLYQNPGISLTSLGKLSFTDGASTSRMVYGMEEKGLVQRQSKEGDRRLFVLSLTDAGKALYEGADAELRADIQKRFAGIDSDLLQSAQTLCDVISQHRKNQESA